MQTTTPMLAGCQDGSIVFTGMLFALAVCGRFLKVILSLEDVYGRGTGEAELIISLGGVPVKPEFALLLLVIQTPL